MTPAKGPSFPYWLRRSRESVTRSSGAGRRCAPNAKRQTPNASLPCQTLECFSIFFAGLFNYFRREAGRRRSFIPVKSLEVVANKLFVVTEWAGPDLVTIGRPEA